MPEEYNYLENMLFKLANVIIKDRIYLNLNFTNLPHAKRATKNAIKLYNQVRLHLPLDFKTIVTYYRISETFKY